MDKNFIIDQNMINYIFSHTNNLHKVQKKLLKYNEKLGHIKKLQISILQANFIQFIIKINNYKSYLEIGTFTGYSILSAALALPKNCKLIGIDKNLKTNNEAIKFFKEAKQDKKINLLCENGKIALENLIKKKEKSPPKYQDVFGNTIVELAKINDKIMGIHQQCHLVLH